MQLPGLVRKNYYLLLVVKIKKVVERLNFNHHFFQVIVS